MILSRSAHQIGKQITVALTLPLGHVNQSTLRTQSRWWKLPSYVSIIFPIPHFLPLYDGRALWLNDNVFFFLVGKIIDVHFVPGNASLSVTSSKTLQDLNTSLEAWRTSLPEHIKYSPEEGSDSVWTCLLHLAYK